MIKNEVNARKQTLQPTQAAPVLRSDSVASSRPDETAGVGAASSPFGNDPWKPFAGDDAE